MITYDQWTRDEIARLRTEAAKALAEADTLQRTFEKWRETQGQKVEPQAAAKPQQKQELNGHSERRRGKRLGHGNKNATALEKLGAAGAAGMNTDELYAVFSTLYGPKYKRSSLRALLWHQKELGNIDSSNGRHTLSKYRVSQ